MRLKISVRRLILLSGPLKVKMKTLSAMLLVFVLQIVNSAVVNKKEISCDGNLLEDYKNCEELSTATLMKILGKTYNRRYMSITRPKDKFKYGKRNLLDISEQFYLPPDYVRELFPEEEDQQQQKREIEDFNNQTSTKRSLSLKSQEEKNTQPWSCNVTPQWIDLGEDYFPRYIQIAECGSEKCWYGQYYCVQNSFTVFLLRKSTECKSSKISKKNARNSPPWVWVERALPFMCDCVKTI